MGVPTPYYMYHTRHSHPTQRISSCVSHRVSVFTARVRTVAFLAGGRHREHPPPVWGNLTPLFTSCRYPKFSETQDLVALQSPSPQG